MLSGAYTHIDHSVSSSRSSQEDNLLRGQPSISILQSDCGAKIESKINRYGRRNHFLNFPRVRCPQWKAIPRVLILKLRVFWRIRSHVLIWPAGFETIFCVGREVVIFGIKIIVPIGQVRSGVTTHLYLIFGINLFSISPILFRKFQNLFTSFHRQSIRNHCYQQDDPLARSISLFLVLKLAVTTLSLIPIILHFVWFWIRRLAL